MKHSLIFGIVSVALFACAVIFGLQDRMVALFCTAFIGLASLFAAVNDIKSLKAGRDGIEITRRELQEVQIKLADLQVLAAALARAVLTAGEGAGRLGGMPDAQKATLVDEVIRALERVNLPKDMLDGVLQDIRRYAAFDYAHFILDTARESIRKEEEVRDWNQVRGKGLGQVANPVQIEEFLNRYGFLTDWRQDLLADYRHFLTHSEHRRPEVWAVRAEWRMMSRPGATKNWDQFAKK